MNSLGMLGSSLAGFGKNGTAGSLLQTAVLCNGSSSVSLCWFCVATTECTCWCYMIAPQWFGADWLKLTAACL